MTNGIFILDKPAGMTSHDVVGRMRRLLGQKRVGHGGTLDPMATGVLPVFAGRSTHAAAYVQEGGKRYAARLKLGIVTDTQDTTGTVLETRPVTVGRAELEALLPRFTGALSQRPPMYSAVSVNGVRLYRLARQGVEVERPLRQVSVEALTLGAQTGENEYELTIDCSKGLYVRTLIADLGEALGCGAAMSALRRLRAGCFSIEEAITLEEAARLAEAGTLPHAALCADLLFRELPELRLDEAGERVIRNGARLRTALPDGLCRLYGADGTFLGPGTVENGAARIQKSFY